jgi:hypothetical protein
LGSLQSALDRHRGWGRCRRRGIWAAGGARQARSTVGRKGEGLAAEPGSPQPILAKATERAITTAESLMGRTAWVDRNGSRNSTYPFGVDSPANGSQGRSDRPSSGNGMPLSSPSDVTLLLRQWSEGAERGAQSDRSVDVRRASSPRASPPPRRAGQPLPQYNRVGARRVREAGRRTAGAISRPFAFLAMASRVMRRLLIDQARARRAAKRGGGAEAANWATPS